MGLIECFIPAYNAAANLEANVRRLVIFCRKHCPGTFRVVIVNNGSTDDTPAIAKLLSTTYPEVRVVHYVEKGRGRALRRAFLNSNADWIGYMDADLSTRLNALPKALEHLAAGANLVIGSRLLPGSLTCRQLYREILSRVYNRIVRILFRTGIRDHQCGFKFMTRATCACLVPHTQDDLWFFDTELLVLASRKGLKIDELSVDWIEDLNSTVSVARTIVDNLLAMEKLRLRLRDRAR